MPSPLSGLTQAAASPTRAQLGPATPLTAPPIGSRALVGARSSSPSPNASRTLSAYDAIRERTFRSAGRLAVASGPTPRFTSDVPDDEPSGKIQPYPDSTSWRSPRSSRWELIHGSSAIVEVT